MRYLRHEVVPSYMKWVVEEVLRPDNWSVHEVPTQCWLVVLLFSEISKSCLDKFRPRVSSTLTGAASVLFPELDLISPPAIDDAAAAAASTPSLWNWNKLFGTSKPAKKGNLQLSADKMLLFPFELTPIWKPISFWGWNPPRFELIVPPLANWERFCKAPMKGNCSDGWEKWLFISVLQLEGLADIDLGPVWLPLCSLVDGDFELLLLLLLFLRQPPPTGTFLRAPPLVQYLRQVLQKCRGCVRL